AEEVAAGQVVATPHAGGNRSLGLVGEFAEKALGLAPTPGGQVIACREEARRDTAFAGRDDPLSLADAELGSPALLCRPLHALPDQEENQKGAHAAEYPGQRQPLAATSRRVDDAEALL